ncbi:hypothetical protein GBF38_000097 [Nibea albiflora]|nr:hypothetical protein GBF38_000097 [Nibea albiflora]
MDQCLEIYANVEEASRDHNICAREIKDSENIYGNLDKIQTVKPKRTGPAHSGTGDVKKSSCRAAAVCLGLLCLLLLIGLITLVFLYTKGNSERDQLQTSYNNLTKERDQLQKRFDDMAKKRNDLLRELQELGWMYFSGSLYYNFSVEKSWNQSRDDCQQRGADLVIINSKEEQDFIRSFQKQMWIGLTDRETEGTWKWVDGTPMNISPAHSHVEQTVPAHVNIMDQCLEIYENVEEGSRDHNSCAREIKNSDNIHGNLDEIQTVQPKRTGPALSDTRGNSERNQLQTSYNNLTKEQDQLQTSYNNLTEERDQLQTSYNNLTKEQDQLQTSYNNLNKERDQLQKRFDDMTKERKDVQRKLQEGWVYFSGSLYYNSSVEKSWNQSRDDCQQRGADLVIINSKEEQKWRTACNCLYCTYGDDCFSVNKDFIRSFQKQMWIGLSDNETEGTWKWVDGTLLTTSYWKSGEPNHAVPEEDCAVIRKSDSEKNWYDDTCYRKNYWMCEKRLP